MLHRDRYGDRNGTGNGTAYMCLSIKIYVISIILNYKSYYTLELTSRAKNIYSQS